MNMNFVFTLQFIWLFSGTGRAAEKSAIDILYQTMLQNYNLMLSRISDSSFVAIKNCQNSCNESTDSTQRSRDECHCDQRCVAFRDCCLDYWQSCNISFLDAFNQTQQYECLESSLQLSNRSKISYKFGYQVVTKCPRTFQNPELKRRCTNPESTPFVEGNDNRTYRNVECALCNGVRTWKIWNTHLRCPKPTFFLIQERLESKNFSFSYKERETIRDYCKVEMSPPNNATAFKCEVVSECQDKNSSDYLKCIVYKKQLYPLNPESLTVRNPHCARCRADFFFLFLLERPFSWTEPGSGNSLAILFDFSKASQIYGTESTKKSRTCPKSELYDFQLNTCRKQRIKSNFIPTMNWTCSFQNETFPNSSTYFVLHENNSIFVFAHRQSYEPNDYHWHNENVTVCGNFTKHSPNLIENSKVRLYSKTEFNLTVVGYSLSILALLLVLLTYTLFNELRTLPGKTTMNLSVALLLSQLVFLVEMFEEFSGGVCKGIAIVLHYLYLSSFCWMSVLGFDVAKTFLSKGRRSQLDSKKQAFFLRSFYAWVLPLLLVIIALSIDISGAIDIGYGNAQYCWITNPEALAIFFIAPVTSILLFNIIALVLVLVSIRRERKITKKIINRPTTKQDFRICWKLTTVFGLTWILGLGAPYHIALRIMFIVCNSLQGVFLMAGFILTRRALNLYLRMAGMGTMTSRIAATQSTMSSVRTRRRSNSVGKAWVKSKPVTKQHDLPKKLEKIQTIKTSSELPGSVEIGMIETNL